MNTLPALTEKWLPRVKAVASEPSVRGAALVSRGVTLHDLLGLPEKRAKRLIALAESAMSLRHGIRSKTDHCLRISLELESSSLLCMECGPLMLILPYTDKTRQGYLTNLVRVTLREMLEQIPASLDWETEIAKLETERPGLGGLKLERIPRHATHCFTWTSPLSIPALKFTSDARPGPAQRSLPFQKILSKETLRIVLPRPKPPA